MREALIYLLWLLGIGAVTAITLFIINTIIRMVHCARLRTIKNLRIELKQAKADKNITMIRYAGVLAELQTVRGLNVGLEGENAFLHKTINEQKKTISDLQHGKKALNVRGKAVGA